MLPRARLRNARLACIGGTWASGGPNEPGGREASGSVSRVSMLRARLDLLTGTTKSGRPASAKSYSRRKSAIQLDGNRLLP